MITPGALLILRKACIDPSSCSLSMVTLRELILNQNYQLYDFLKLVVELSYVEHDLIRQESYDLIKELAVYPDIQEFIRSQMMEEKEKHVKLFLE